MKEKKNNKFDFFKIRDNDLEKGKLILKKLEFRIIWYVTLHVRGRQEMNFLMLFLALMLKIKAIVSRGGYVIRVGDKTYTTA